MSGNKNTKQEKWNCLYIPSSRNIFGTKDSSTLGLGVVEEAWQCRFTDKKSILQTQRRRVFHSHSVLGQLCSFCLHLELNSPHSPRHLSWVTVWKWSYCLLLCPVERLIDRWAIAKNICFFPAVSGSFKEHSTLTYSQKRNKNVGFPLRNQEEVAPQQILK